MATNITLINIYELSLRIKISDRWIRKQIKLSKNPMPHYRVGARLRFYYPKVLDWLEAKALHKL